MFNRVLAARPTAVRPSLFRSNPTRGFSTGQVKPPGSGLGMGPMLSIGGATAGFLYLGYSINAMNRNKLAYMAEGHTMMSPLVQQRLRNTFGFFSYGILTTAATVYACRNTMAWAAIPWWGYMGGMFAMMYGCRALDYQT